MQTVTKSDVSVPPEHSGREDVKPMDGVVAAAITVNSDVVAE